MNLTLTRLFLMSQDALLAERDVLIKVLQEASPATRKKPLVAYFNFRGVYLARGHHLLCRRLYASNTHACTLHRAHERNAHQLQRTAVGGGGLG